MEDAKILGNNFTHKKLCFIINLSWFIEHTLNSWNIHTHRQRLEKNWVPIAESKLRASPLRGSQLVNYLCAKL